MLQDKSVLLVEDEPLVAMLVEDMLAGLGAHVVGPAATFTEAVEIAQNARFDIAVLDVKLGQDNSSKVAEILQQRRIPYVLATGFDTPAQASGKHAAPFLQKPYLQDDLKRALEAAFEQSHSAKLAAHT